MIGLLWINAWYSMWLWITVQYVSRPIYMRPAQRNLVKRGLRLDMGNNPVDVLGMHRTDSYL